MSAEAPTLRPFARGDEPGIIALVSSVYGEYGDICEPEGFDIDLAEVSERIIAPGGAFWVYEAEGRVVGCVGVKPRGDGVCELKRLYLTPGLRGRGLGRGLCEQVLSWARAKAMRRVELWSDVRFLEAHGLYARMGFETREETRTLEDVNASVERPFWLDLGGST